LFSGVCLEIKKVSFEIKGLGVRLKNRQFCEASQNQRKFPNCGKLSKDLSTGTVDIKTLEPSSFFVAGRLAGESV
jgi:hypothetical protein